MQRQAQVSKIEILFTQGCVHKFSLRINTRSSNNVRPQRVSVTKNKIETIRIAE